MKKILFATMLLFATTAIVHAQDGEKKKAQWQWNKKTMDELGISADVQTKIDAVKTANDAELKKVKEDGALSDEQRKEKIKELRKKRMADIEALLTPEQKTKADAMRKAMKNPQTP